MVIQNWHQVFKQKHPFWKYLSLQPAKNHIDSETLIKLSSKEIRKQKPEENKIQAPCKTIFAFFFFFLLTIFLKLFQLRVKAFILPSHSVAHPSASQITQTGCCAGNFVLSYTEHTQEPQGRFK